MRCLLPAVLSLLPSLAFAGGLYWSDRPSGTQSIRACNFNGTNLRTIRTLTSGTDPRGVCIDLANDRIYYLARFTGNNTGELHSIDFTNGNFVQHITGLGLPADLRLDPTNRVLYWCEEGGTIRKTPLPPAVPGVLTPQSVFPSVFKPYYLDLDLTNGRIYWGDSSTSIYSGPIAGSLPDPALITGGANMRGVGLDIPNGMIYWVERDDTHKIRRRLITGGPVQDLYTGQNAPHGLVLDLSARKMYWVDTGTNGSGGFNARGVSRGDMDGSGAAEIIVQGASVNQPWDIDLDRRVSTYAEWVGRYFRLNAAGAVTDPLANPDGDSDVNLLEYGAGNPPLNSQGVPFATSLPVTDGPNQYGGIRYRRRATASDLVYRVEVSDDLVTWHDNSMPGGPYTVEVYTEAAEDGMQWVVARSVTPISAGSPPEFMRVKVVVPGAGIVAAAATSSTPAIKVKATPAGPKARKRLRIR